MKSSTVVLMSMLVTLLASACASTQPITEPVAVVEAFFEALNDGNLDAAMNFVADDARFITDTLHTGKAQVREFYETGLGSNTRFELSDLRQDGDEVFFMIKGIGELGEFDAEVEMEVQGGKIVSYLSS